MLAARVAARDLVKGELPVLGAHHADVADLWRGERLQVGGLNPGTAGGEKDERRHERAHVRHSARL